MRLATKGFWLIPAVIVGCASVASAHPGSSMHNMLDGVTHPLTGMDHMLAMIAVGVWAALGTRRHVWLVPLTFVTTLVIGLVVGRLLGGVPGTELLIAASVIAVGLLIATRVAVPTIWACAAAGLFALFHGLAHGSEMPKDVAAWNFAVGMVITTAFLHAIGISVGTLVSRTKQESLVRWGGAAVACCGVLIAVGRM